MDVRTKTIVLSGDFRALTQAEAKRRLEALGAHVQAAPTGTTDLIFEGSNSQLSGSARGIPMFDEAALLAVLDGGAAAKQSAVTEASVMAKGPYDDHPLPDAVTGPEAVLAALRAADWTVFVPGRDLPPLRALMATLEHRHGVTEAHRYATARIVELGTPLQHPCGDRGEFASMTLSPCGQFLATGNPDEADSGMVQIWELASGRCVNAIDGIEGGVGLPGYARSIQWSADGTRLALDHDTNNIGVWDPFGTSHQPQAAAAVTDGAGRPPGFALAPDGGRAYVAMGSEREVPGLVVPLGQGFLYWNPWYAKEASYAEAGPTTMAPLLSEAVRETLGASDLEPPAWVGWSGDGMSIHAVVRPSPEDSFYDDHHPLHVLSIDAATGEVRWIAPTDRHLTSSTSVDTPAAWSPDDRLVAHHDADATLVRDAATGQPVSRLPHYPGAARLSWGRRGEDARLAIVVRDDDADERTPPGVFLHDVDQYQYRVDVSPARRSYDLPDVSAWAWAPDGTRAACLTTEQQVEIWSLADDAPERIRILPASDAIHGVLWGADDVLVLAGPTMLRFVHADTGDVLGDFDFSHEPEDPRPLELNGYDLAWEYRIDPTYALDDSTWACAFEQGLVIAPDNRRDALDATLTWAVGRRHAWPVRWGDLDVYPDAATAAEAIGAAAGNR